MSFLSRPLKLHIVVTGNNYVRFKGEYIWGNITEMYEQVLGPGIIKQASSQNEWFVADRAQQKKLLSCRLMAGESLPSGLWVAGSDSPPLDGEFRVAFNLPDIPCPDCERCRQAERVLEQQISALEQRVRELEEQLVRERPHSPVIRGPILELPDTINNHTLLDLIKHRLRDPVEQVLDFEFPSGNEIVADYKIFCRRLRNDVGGLVTCLQEPSTNPDSYPIHESTVPGIMNEIYTSAVSFIKDQLTTVRNTLSREFGVADIEADPTAKRFYLRSMQKVKYPPILQSIAANAQSRCASSIQMRQLSQTMNRLKSEGALDSTTCIEDYFTGFAKAYLMCALSDPPCLLHPLPGVSLSSDANARNQIADAANVQPRTTHQHAVEYKVLAPALYLLDEHSMQAQVPDCRGVYGCFRVRGPVDLHDSEEVAVEGMVEVQIHGEHSHLSGRYILDGEVQVYRQVGGDGMIGKSCDCWVIAYKRGDSIFYSNPNSPLYSDEWYIFANHQRTIYITSEGR